MSVSETRQRERVVVCYKNVSCIDLVAKILWQLLLMPFYIDPGS